MDEQPVTLDLVRAALPPGAVLVEFSSFRPSDERLEHLTDKRWKEAEYVAYILEPQGPIRFARLGPTRALDRLIADARRSLARRDPGAKRALRRLDEKLMRPVRALIGSPRDVYLAPDGLLNVLPFAALVDEDGEYLTRRYRFTYLTSGRDLLRERESSENRSGAVVYAAPDYGEQERDARADPSLLGSVTFAPLPATVEEGSAVTNLLGAATLRTGDKASEASVKELRGPRVVHVATHGFFLGQETVGAGIEARGLQLVESDDVPSSGALGMPDPMLLSGLAFSGANRQLRDREDGILTASELANVDLLGTKLVVLSACDTGLGHATTGDAVYGLRRALVLSGAQTQVTSLWRVNDAATRALMTAFYRRLANGDGRSNALREVALAALGDKATTHPYYWAPFIVSGNQRSLDGSLAPVVRVSPSATAEIRSGD